MNQFGGSLKGTMGWLVYRGHLAPASLLGGRQKDFAHSGLLSAEVAPPIQRASGIASAVEPCPFFADRCIH